MRRRYEISDEHWERIKEDLPGKSSDVGRTAKDNREFVNAVLWVLRNGASWADLPERYGKYKSVHNRSNQREKRQYDPILYKDRNLIEKLFSK